MWAACLHHWCSFWCPCCSLAATQPTWDAQLICVCSGASSRDSGLFFPHDESVPSEKTWTSYQQYYTICCSFNVCICRIRQRHDKNINSRIAHAYSDSTWPLVFLPSAFILAARPRPACFTSAVQFEPLWKSLPVLHLPGFNICLSLTTSKHHLFTFTLLAWSRASAFDLFPQRFTLCNLTNRCIKSKKLICLSKGQFLKLCCKICQNRKDMLDIFPAGS